MQFANTLSKILLWLTPVLLVFALPVVGFSVYVSLAAGLVVAVLASATWPRERGSTIVALLVFSVIWWPMMAAAGAALALALFLRLPRLHVPWVAGAAAGSLLVFSITNPPYGPLHLGSAVGLTVVFHAVALAIAVIASIADLRRPS